MFFSHAGATNSHKRGRKAAAAASNDVDFSGNVIANPCTLTTVSASAAHRSPSFISTTVPTSLLPSRRVAGYRPTICTSIGKVSFVSPLNGFRHRCSSKIWQFTSSSRGMRSTTSSWSRGSSCDGHWRRSGRGTILILDLLGAAEEVAGRRLREKEAEMAKATGRNTELRARAAQLTVEAQVWQAKLRAQEAAAAWLQDELQQAINGSGHDKISREHGGSEVEDAKLAYVDLEGIAVASWQGCPACGQKVAAAAVLLPCRYLGVCRECDRVAKACPVCFTARQSSDHRGPSHEASTRPKKNPGKLKFKKKN